ncbi:zinc transporter 10-like [Choloepus didactylus]|uniref:zinc transporter 10-like n=1 Tax=Choloepus didactylus TaxID=27675 RepID=UPI0018A0FE35|nr:zinc transporter 10-like [Choloepus didactylus]
MLTLVTLDRESAGQAPSTALRPRLEPGAAIWKQRSSMPNEVLIKIVNLSLGLQDHEATLCLAPVKPPYCCPEGLYDFTSPPTVNRSSSLRNPGCLLLSKAEIVGSLYPHFASQNLAQCGAVSLTLFVAEVNKQLYRCWYINPQKTEEALLVLSAGIIGLFFNVLNYVIFLDCCYCTAPRPQGDIETGDSLNIQNEPEETVRKEKKSEALTIRGVLLHMMGDTLGPVVVVIVAIIFYVLPLKPEDPCNWQCYIDPSLTVIMVIIILSSAFPLFRETAAILLQMVPKGVNMEELMSKLSSVPGISNVHEVHIWELTSGKIIATLHIKYPKDGGYQDASIKIREIFHNAGIHNVTIQFENVDWKESQEQQDLLFLCSSPCISKSCAKQLLSPQTLPWSVNSCAEHSDSSTLDLYQSDGPSRRDITEVAIEVSLDGRLSNHRLALKNTQEDQHYVNITYF